MKTLSILACLIFSLTASANQPAPESAPTNSSPEVPTAATPTAPASATVEVVKDEENLPKKAKKAKKHKKGQKPSGKVTK